MIIDIILIVLVLLFVILGIVKGFMKSLLSLFSGLVALVLAVVFAKPFAGLLQNWFSLGDFLGTQVVNTITLPEISGQMLGSDIASALSSQNSSFLINFCKNFIDANTYYTSETLFSTLSSSVGALLLVILSGIVLFLLIKIVVAILSKLIDKLTTKSKSIRGLDRVLGGGFGFVKVSLIIVVLLSLCYVLGSIIPQDWLNTNQVLNFYYNISVKIFDSTISKIDFNSLLSSLI